VSAHYVHHQKGYFKQALKRKCKTKARRKKESQSLPNIIRWQQRNLKNNSKLLLSNKQTSRRNTEKI